MKKESNKNTKREKKWESLEISATPTGGLPDTAYEMVTNYGTYEIQATADTANQYPAIAQGYNPKIKKRDCQNSHHGGKWETEKKD